MEDYYLNSMTKDMYNTNKLNCIVVVIFLVMVVLLQSCARGNVTKGFYFHSAANEEKAKEADQAFKDAELGKSFVGERKSLEAITDRQVTTSEKVTISLRNLTLIQMINSTGGSYSTITEEIVTRIKELVLVRDQESQSPEEPVELSRLVRNVLVRINSAASLFVDIKIAYDLNQPSSKDPKLICPIPEDFELSSENQNLHEVFLHFVETCNNYQKSVHELYSLLFKCKQSDSGEVICDSSTNSSIISKLIVEKSRIEHSINTVELEVQKRLKSYVDAKKKYKAALARSGENAELAKNLEEKIKDLGNMAIEIGDFANDFPLGKVAKLEIYLNSLNQILEAYIQENGEPTSSSNTEVNDEETDDSINIKVPLRIASFLGSMVSIIGSNFKYPGVTSLLLESEHLNLELKAAKQRIANHREILSVLDEKLAAAEKELLYLNLARTQISTENYESLGCRTKTIENAFNNQDCSEYLVRSLVLYSDSWIIGRLQLEKADYKIYGIQQIGILDNSEIALAQWVNLIGIPISQLVALHGSGISAEDISNIVNALGWTVVGIGVNKGAF